MSSLDQDIDPNRLLNFTRPVKLRIDIPNPDAGVLDIESIIFQALVNEVKHLKV